MTRATALPHNAAMSNDADTLKTELAALTDTLDAAIERINRMAEENASLRRGRDQLVSERAQLLTRNEQARTRVEAMIERLKSLENAG